MAEAEGFEDPESLTTHLNTLEDYVDWKGRPALQGKHGGVRATIFIYVMEGFENMAFIANAVNLFTYFHNFMHYDLADSSTALTNFIGTSFLLALIGAIISDSYITRFHTNIIFGSIELIGYILLTIQAHLPSLTPPTCDISNPATICNHVRGRNASILYLGLYLIAVGTGGVKAALPSLGANQFGDKDPKESRLMSSFFNWFFFSLSIGASIGVTVLVWIQNNKGWDWGIGISSVAVALAIGSLLCGTSTYRNQVPRGRPLIRVLQVFVAAIRNKNLRRPGDAGKMHELNNNAAAFNKDVLQKSRQFRFLDKAALRSETSKEPESSWRLCTVTQVEEAKVLLRMVPIFASTIMVSTCLAQLQTFSVQQGMTMDTQMGSFHIPPASLSIIPLLVLVFLTPFYDMVFVPFARRITGRETGITHLQRVGVGLVLSAISMAIAAVVEVKRKTVAREHGMLDAIPVAEPLPMTVWWLGFQYFVFGLADLFTFVGLLQFFYSEAPSGMKSMGTAFPLCSVAMGYFLSTVMVSIVNSATAKITGSGGWLHGNNLNRNHLNLFYLTLSVLSVVNFFNYLFWSRWYQYKALSPNQMNAFSEYSAT